MTQLSLPTSSLFNSKHIAIAATPKPAPASDVIHNNNAPATTTTKNTTNTTSGGSTSLNNTATTHESLRKQEPRKYGISGRTSAYCYY